MNKPMLAIIGASGHGRVVADIAMLLNQYSSIVYFDDAYGHGSISNTGITIVGTIKDLLQQVNQFHVVVAIGENKTRMAIMCQLQQYHAHIISLIHPKAIICSNVQIGIGSVIMAGAVINTGVVLGKGCIINSNSVVEHDCQLMDGVHISPGACLAGGVQIEEGTWIGIGATVNQLIKIGKQVIVGAGSVVINNIKNNTTVVGSPARIIKESNRNESC